MIQYFCILVVKMKKYAEYYHDGKIKCNRDGLYYHTDDNHYLFSYGIYRTKIKEEDLPDYYVKLWLYPRQVYLSLKNIKDIYYRPSFFTNHWRKDDLLYISYNDLLDIRDNGYADKYDVIVYGPELDHFIEKLKEYGYDNNKLQEIALLMQKKDKWYKYWEEHNWKGNYSFTSKEILGDEK